MSRPAFHFDLNRCTGCAACQVACIIENQLPWDRSWRKVLDANPEGAPAAPTYHLSMACNHCETAVCMKACPALAYSRDHVTGALLIDADKCIGCSYCSWVCPYDAPSVNHDRGIMEKCTFCAPRLADGKEPACVSWCPTDALGLTSTESGFTHQNVEGFKDAGLGPALELIPLAQGRRRPEIELDPATAALISEMSLPRISATRGISLRKEWTLLLFTWLAPLMVGLFSAVPSRQTDVPPLAFAGAGVLLMLLASLHLGNKARAWRVILGWRGSWLSREIILWPAFLGAGFIYLQWQLPTAWAIPALLLGAGSLFSMDRLYTSIDAGRGPRLPSSSTLLTALFYLGIFTGSMGLAKSVLAAKLLLYLAAKVRAALEGRSFRPGLSLTRIFLGFLTPALAFYSQSPAFAMLLIPAILVAEFVDRMEFYFDLELGSPKGQMERDNRAFQE
ncbi:4Fe-4S dicluster domain-containing protein [bacterium]|nr:4Fe-4S dicluster domain-containing protein [bacterium]